MTPSYLFYDLETSGLHKAFDQVLQFAGKRLDENMQETKESFFYEVKPNPDVIPSPMAMLTHGIRIDQHQDALNEITATALIHRHLNTPGTINLGYNTLGFDDEFLRFSFYRNLLSPYTHQYALGCKRMDIFPIAVFYYLYASDSLIWPQIDGKVSLKLEAIATENGWLTGKAHHAMVDVDATVALAQKMRTSYPEVWAYCAGFFDKQTDYDRITQLPEAFHDSTGHHLGLMVHALFGAQNAFQAPVVSLGRHNHYKNQIVFLRLDQPIDHLNYQDLDSAGLIIRKKLQEPGFLIPYDAHYARHMSEERKEIASHNLSKIRLLKQDLADLSHEAREYTHPSVENIDIDAALYETGFKSQEEEQQCHLFHLSGPELKAKQIIKFKNPLLQAQAARVLWRIAPEAVPKKYQKEIHRYMQAILDGTPVLDYRGNAKYNLPQALAEIQALRQKPLSEQDQKQLDHLETTLLALKDNASHF